MAKVEERVAIRVGRVFIVAVYIDFEQITS